MKRFLLVLILLLSLGQLTANCQSKDAETNAKNRLKLTLYYSSHCGACMRLENEYIPVILKKYGDKIDLTQKEIGEEQNLQELLQINPEGTVPTMVVAGRIFVGVDEIEENVTPIIQAFVEGKLNLKDAKNQPGEKKKP